MGFYSLEGEDGEVGMGGDHIEFLSSDEGRNQLCAAEGKWKQLYLLVEGEL